MTTGVNLFKEIEHARQVNYMTLFYQVRGIIEQENKQVLDLFPLILNNDIDRMTVQRIDDLKASGLVDNMYMTIVN